MYLIEIKPRSAEAVYTHTSNLVKKNKIYKNKKGNILMPCGYYDTG